MNSKQTENNLHRYVDSEVLTTF